MVWDGSGVESDGTGCDRMGWDGMEWGGAGWCVVVRDGAGLCGMMRDGVAGCNDGAGWCGMVRDGAGWCGNGAGWCGGLGALVWLIDPIASTPRSLPSPMRPPRSSNASRLNLGSQPRFSRMA